MARNYEGCVAISLPEWPQKEKSPFALAGRYGGLVGVGVSEESNEAESESETAQYGKKLGLERRASFLYQTDERKKECRKIIVDS